MRFEGEALVDILRSQTEPVLLCDATGAPFATKSGAELGCSPDDLKGVIGVGNKKRIRYLQAVSPSIWGAGWRGGSRTTRRVPILNEQGQKVTGLLIREHRGTLSDSR